RTLLLYVAVAVFVAFALGLLLVVVLHAIVPEKVEAALNSTNAKLTELLLAFSVFSAIGLQVALYFYLPTSRRLALSLIYWGCGFFILVPFNLAIASMKFGIIPEPKEGEHWIYFELADKSLSWSGVFASLVSLGFIYLMFCKYQALNEKFLADVD
ncbi:MAG: hypothetical protein NXI28_15875, partial [bacterium]|nr:hypothetical protein [bacterium]